MTSPNESALISATIVHTMLEDGRRICIRAVRPDDEPRMRKGVELLSKRSRYLRFFSVAPAQPDKVIAKLVAVDGHRHLAWGAILTDERDHQAIGAVHAVRDAGNSSTAEYAIGILDAYHGLGLARILTTVLLIHCRFEGIAKMDVQILAENQAAVNLVKSLGGERCRTEQGVAEYVLETAVALKALQLAVQPAALKAVFAAFRQFL